MSRLGRNFLVPVLLLAFAGAAAYFMVNSRDDLPRRERAPAIPVVQVIEVIPGSVPVTIESRGMVTPLRDIELVSEVSGRVVWVDPGFLQGEEVVEGQKLLRLEPIDYEVAVSDAQAALASAELSLAEVEVLVQKAAIVEAEARVVAARDRLRQARTDLANTEISAPFDAVVDAKQVDLGQYVQTGKALTRLLSTDIAEVRLPLLASDVPFVEHGQDDQGNWPELTLTASFGDMQYSWQARLARVERRVDEQTRVFYLVAQVERPYDLSLHPHILAIGLFVEASFQGRPIANASRLPRSALHMGNRVYVVEEGILRQREVTLLRREGDAVIIGTGLHPGDRVVTSRLSLMVDGMPVQVEG
ncbi:efflux RND transporter periplasmic adaptor subunit [Pseudohalioglobus lutimaris]|uniref:Efflux RND transporter periplasmic adaptor subunit n=1 Tax=Pseudohalioglobus lutimaris TaxID=1737061 RepID=A0A2N5X6P8_9GAMM|nr:efflux RND transporter periplasmic adaptor subunit [Pseudohalioglobus lutimaris]PLW70158.1 efflux RND transporter periplasmic adaptor subunit [Pseudohalioglobus lutimaris]